MYNLYGSVLINVEQNKKIYIYLYMSIFIFISHLYAKTFLYCVSVTHVQSFRE